MWSSFSPPSNFVSGHVSTMWFVVCRGLQSQEGDWERSHSCRFAQHGPCSVRKRFSRDHVWGGRSRHRDRHKDRHKDRQTDRRDQIYYQPHSWMVKMKFLGQGFQKLRARAGQTHRRDWTYYHGAFMGGKHYSYSQYYYCNITDFLHMNF